MAEELTTTGTEGTKGQPDEGSLGTTQPGTGGTEGQSVDGQSGTTDTGSLQSPEDTFFDPASIADKPELMAAYKQMQRDYGKKMEGIKTNQTKIQAYDAFNTDPVGTLQQYAKQLGFTLSRAEATQQLQTGGEPQTWDEVYQTAEERAYARIRKDLDPILGQFQDLRKNNMERLLDDNAPDWRQYEDVMTDNLRAHPTLANDPVTLYRLSVPPEVLESRATQAALRKLQTKTNGSRTSGVSTTKPTSAGDEPDGPVSFNEAVRLAKEKLARDGISPGV